MTSPHHAPDYPNQAIRVVPFQGSLLFLFTKPTGLFEATWPPQQLEYMGEYLKSLGCKTIVVEEHYIDRDFISDLAAFYSRSLRNYPNSCRRFHFFDDTFDQAKWDGLVEAASEGKLEATENYLRNAYLGYSVMRPLAGSPVGRTVLGHFPEATSSGDLRFFDGVRKYDVHLAGFRLSVRGLAFQQQDRGVSACATTALWVAMHKTAPLEGLAIPTPAEITDAASRYYLPGGRSLPSEGLTLDQICEATRAGGLAPLVVQSSSPEVDRAQILGYTRSGFPVIFALEGLDGGSDGHAVCCVGVRLGEVNPQTDPSLHFRDAATALKSVYIHDDRLGPYASADIVPYTVPDPRTGRPLIRTGVSIRWPGTETASDWSLLTALIVPVPLKLRLTIARMRVLGTLVADAIGRPNVFPQFSNEVILDCRYSTGPGYQAVGYGFGLSTEGIKKLTCGLTMSRYIGVIEFKVAEGPLFDLVLDATETQANPAALACVRRRALPADGHGKLAIVAKYLGVPFIE